MGMLDVDDAQTIEGLHDARDKIHNFIKNILESLESEQGEFVFSLYKHGRGSEEEDPVFTSEIEVGGNVSSLTDEIVEAAQEDVGEFYKGSHKYVVRAENIKARCIFTLKVNTTEDEDMEDVEEAPNKRGLLSQMMRHQEKIMKVAVGSVSKVTDILMKANRDKDDRIAALEGRQIEAIKLTEDLVSGRHARDLELRRIENKEKRMNEITGMVMQGAPLLLNMIAESKNGGGEATAQMSAPAEMPATVPGMSPSRVEALIEGLIDDISDDQLAKLATSGLFTPVQMMALGEIAQSVKKKRESEQAAVQAAREVANAVANGSVTQDNRS